jgi:hypothetical protein
VVKLLVLYLHLIATCTAIGSILATDLRLMARLRDPGFRVAPPNRFVTQLVAGSLALLYVTGVWLIAIGLVERGDYLENQKLLGKLLLVVVLTVNAVALHFVTFPRLQRGKRLGPWSLNQAFGVALPIAISTALWLFCAFLGIARPWNHVVPLGFVLAIAAALTIAAWSGVMLLLMYAARAPRATAAVPPRPKVAPVRHQTAATTSLAQKVGRTPIAKPQRIGGELAGQLAAD